jgi:hypothetical protein
MVAVTPPFSDRTDVAKGISPTNRKKRMLSQTKPPSDFAICFSFCACTTQNRPATMKLSA